MYLVEVGLEMFEPPLEPGGVDIHELGSHRGLVVRWSVGLRRRLDVVVCSGGVGAV